MTSQMVRLRAGILKALEKFPRIDAKMRIANRRALARSGAGYPDWTAIEERSADWETQRESAAKGRRVLLATSIGSHLGAMQVETVLAAALTLRGAQVEILLCDEILPGCQMCEPRFFPDKERFAKQGPQKDICGYCYTAGKSKYEELGLKVHAYSSQLIKYCLRNQNIAKQFFQQIYTIDFKK